MSKSFRFEFGKNWLAYASHIDEPRVSSACEGVREQLGDIEGKTFIDVGSGSGVMSLAAHRLGARVFSFDVDPLSVACTRAVSERFDGHWPVEHGSVLDPEYLAKQGQFDVVYSWGVLHHTGAMWSALENIIRLVAPHGQLCIAIYNDQGWRSRYWLAMKRLYNSNAVARLFVTALHLVPLSMGRVFLHLLTGRFMERRGMNLWHDYIDWIGGYPFEFASIGELRTFYETRGFRLEKVTDVGTKSGCNELTFRRL